MFSRLGSRIAVTYATLVAVLALAGAAGFTIAAERALDREMSARTLAVASMSTLEIDSGWIGPLREGSIPVRTRTEQVLLRAATASGATRIVLLDEQGSVLAASDPRIRPGERFAGLAVSSFEADRARETGGSASAPYRGEEAWYQSAWVPHGEALLGVEMAIHWREPLERLRRAVVVFAAAGVLASAGIGLLLARTVTRPLAKLAGAMERSGPDGLPIAAGVRGSDEVGALGRRFDQLVEKLREHDADLRALSATIAHEVRNPLGAMRGFAELIERRSGDGGVRELTAGIREEVDSLERLVVRFLAFAGEVRLSRRPTDLGALLDDALRAGVPAGSRVRVERSFTAVGPMVDCDPDAIREVLVNLLRNGAQATRDTGLLSVAAAGDATGVEVRIRDDGPGIPAEIRPRLFQPFATTKADGTGLGLAICRRIVAGHGGSLSFESGTSGTTFIMKIPAKIPAKAPTSGAA